LDQDGLADARAAEEAHLAALGVGSEEVDDLDPGLEHLLGRREVLDLGRGAVDGPAGVALDGVTPVDRLAQQVEEPPEGRLANRHRDRPAGVHCLVAAAQAIGGVHGHGLDAVVAQVLLHLEHQVDGVTTVALRHLDLERVVDLGQVLVGEDDVDDDAEHLLDRSDPLTVSVALSHLSPYPSASAPATTSKISWVISAWRTRFISSVRLLIMSCAFSAAFRIAV